MPQPDNKANHAINNLNDNEIVNYLNAQDKKLLFKLRKIWNTPAKREKMISYLKAQHFTKNECDILFGVICAPGTNVYQISTKVKPTQSAVYKAIKKFEGLRWFYSELVLNGKREVRPLYPTELLIRNLWDIYAFYETHKFPVIIPTKEQKHTRLKSGLGYVKTGEPAKILLAQQQFPPSVGLWIFPGGYFNPAKGDRDERATVKRRVREITGLEVVVGREIKVYQPLKLGVPTESHIFECKIVRGVITEGEVDDVFVSQIRLWVPNEAVSSHDVREREKYVIRQEEIKKDMDAFPEI